MTTSDVATVAAPTVILPLEILTQNEPLLTTLIQEISCGDEQAMAKLYDATKHMIYGLSLRILGNTSTADDVTLEVYMQVWRQAQAFDDARGTPLVWLTTITRSRAIDRLRQQNNLHYRFESLENVFYHPANTETPETTTLFAERGKKVRAALANLSPAQREVLTLAYYLGMTHTEIATKLGIPLGTIKTRIRHGLKRLRECLEN